MKNIIKTILLGVAATSLLVPASASAAVILFNYAQGGGGVNDMDAGDATALGVDQYLNITNDGDHTGNGGTHVRSLDGVGITITHGSWWQFGHVAALGQPYSSVMSFDTTVVLSGLTAWLAAEGASAYEVTVYYAGRETGNNTPISFADFSSTSSGTVGGIAETLTLANTVTATDTYWAADGATHTFATDTLTITDPRGSDFVGGISAIKLESFATPEPSSAFLLGLGFAAIMLLRRRR